MLHMGDITKISGYDAPTVNVIIGGSPCQDLSVAGKRAGLSGERSGLFMEQIRIIKEMRDKNARSGRTGTDIRPRFMVWENVPGAFSVNKGRDFAAVLEETIRVAEPEAPDIPVPCKGWTTAGCYMGDGWSVAWRVLDAQYWGVPQRRRRIALVADFGGQSAPEILFKPKSVSGHFEPCGEAGQGTAGDVESSIGTICIEGNGCRESHKGNGYAESDAMYTLNTVEQHSVCYGISAYESNSMKSDNPHSGVYEADTSRTLDNNGGNPACNQGGIAVVCLNDQGGSVMDVSHDVTGTIRAQEHGHQPIAVYENHSQDSRFKELGNTSETVSAKYGTGGNNQPIVVSIGNGQMDNMAYSDIANTLDTMHDQQAVMIKEENDATGTQDQVLRILQEAYGEKAVVEWGVAILATLQSAEVLQQGMYDSRDEREAKNGNELDDGSLPRPELVAGWMLRDMREQSERRCSSQGQQSAKQRFEQSSKGMQELPYKNTSSCKEMFYLWEKGKGIGLLREALSEIQKIWKSDNVQRYTVRRLTPLEAERLQGYPSGFEVDVSKMTKDEYIAFNLASGNIIADAETGKVFATRGPGGKKLDEPIELKGTNVKGYHVVSIRNGQTKLQCRVHRIIWISQHGVIPDGYCIDHINNDKSDNRISNLQLLTPKQNSHKAHDDGLYKCGLDNKATKIDPAVKDEIAFIYAVSDLTQRQLAEMYGISKSRINQIVKEVGWTDIGEWVDSKGKKRITSDSARYKALGNSIAIPPWLWVCDQIGQYIGEDKTMASLFDGIGGFPLIWSYLYGKENVLWASEIEEFPIAVTKVRFPDETKP